MTWARWIIATSPTWIIDTIASS